MDPKTFEHTRTEALTFNSATDPGAAVSGGISVIAARIHERAVQLANELDSLREVEQLFEVTKSDHAEKEQCSHRVRIKYLESMMQAMSMELECCRIKDLIAERFAKTQKLIQRTRQIVEQTAKQEEVWKARVEGKLVQHKVRQELYQKNLEGVIRDRNQAIALRKLKLATAARLVVQEKREHDSILQEQQLVQANMMRMTEAEDQANTHVESLAMKVRSTLSKVSRKNDGCRIVHFRVYRINQ